MSSRDSQLIDCLIDKARTAQTHYASNGSQETYDRAALAAAWALMEPCRNRQTFGIGGCDNRAWQCGRQDPQEPPQDAWPVARYQGCGNPWHHFGKSDVRDNGNCPPRRHSRCCRTLDKSGSDTNQQCCQCPERRECDHPVTVTERCCGLRKAGFLHACRVFQN